MTYIGKEKASKKTGTKVILKNETTILPSVIGLTFFSVT
jgi:hypothetical protein